MNDFISENTQKMVFADRLKTDGEKFGAVLQDLISEQLREEGVLPHSIVSTMLHNASTIMGALAAHEGWTEEFTNEITKDFGERFTKTAREVFKNVSGEKSDASEEATLEA